MDQKLEHARAFRDGFKIKRPILVDEVRGSGHQLYGGLSNMTFIVGRGGNLLYKANWTDPGFIQVAVDYFQGVRDQRKEGIRLAPYMGDIIGYRVVDHEEWYSGIGRGGQQALDDFDKVRASAKSMPATRGPTLQ